MNKNLYKKKKNQNEKYIRKIYKKNIKYMQEGNQAFVRMKKLIQIHKNPPLWIYKIPTNNYQLIILTILIILLNFVQWLYQIVVL